MVRNDILYSTVWGTKTKQNSIFTIKYNVNCSCSGETLCIDKDVPLYAMDIVTYN